MKFLILKSYDPYFNLAVEEYLFSHETDDVFMLWQNEPTVVIGKNQNAYAEIKTDVVRERGIKIVRRITGGGAVYHDLGNVNYSFISTRRGGADIDFEYFTAPIIEALTAMGIDAQLSGRNDLLTEGRKFSGNAQHTVGERTLHHGTLLFDADLSVLSDVLNVDRSKIESKAIASVRSRVVNLSELLGEDMTVERFIGILSEFVVRKYAPTVIDVPQGEEVERLAKRNASEEWIFPIGKLTSEYAIVRKKKYDFGIVEIYLNMSNDTITKATVCGDFFGVSDVSELEGILTGARLSEIEKKLAKADVGDYIFGMNAEELAALIRGE